MWSISIRYDCNLQTVSYSTPCNLQNLLLEVGNLVQITGYFGKYAKSYANWVLWNTSSPVQFLKNSPGTPLFCGTFLLDLVHQLYYN